MNRKRKLAVTFTLIGITVILLLFVVFSKKPICNEVVIEYEMNDSVSYKINQEIIKKIIFTEYKNIIGLPFNDIDLNRLELKIEENPSIKNAEVYKKISGSMGVRITFRKPIVRIITETYDQFYIDQEGFLMPLSEEGTTRVIPANGNIKFNYSGKKINILNNKDIPKQIKDIYDISSKIATDKFLNAQIEQIFVKSNREYELIPKVGNHIVLLGDVNRLDKKLKYLKHFYIHVLNTQGWRTYSYINLKFENQIVCTKNQVN
jgi:cell division protein FtsQ